MWSLGALLELPDREKMETFIYKYQKEHGGLNLPTIPPGQWVASSARNTYFTDIYNFVMLRKTFFSSLKLKPIFAV